MFINTEMRMHTNSSRRLNSFIVLLLMLFSLQGCDQPVDIDRSLLKTAVQDAQVLRYSDLTAKEKDDVWPYARFYEDNGDKVVRFKSRDGLYVRATISRQQLAIVSLMYSCQSSTTPCSQKKLDEKTRDLLTYDNPYRLYGKYTNRLAFLSGQEAMPETDQFDGHRLIQIKRSHDRQFDHILIGPLPRQPSAFIILPNRGDNDYLIQYDLDTP